MWATSIGKIVRRKIEENEENVCIAARGTRTRAAALTPRINAGFLRSIFAAFTARFIACALCAHHYARGRQALCACTAQHLYLLYALRAPAAHRAAITAVFALRSAARKWRGGK